MSARFTWVPAVIILLLTRRWALPALADTITQDTYVPSTEPWTNTGLWVEPGDRLSILAWGSVSYADPASQHTVGPDGQPGTSSDQRFVVTDPNVPQNALIGNVALTTSFKDGAGFFVGSNYTGRLPIAHARELSGWLMLGHNDGAIRPGRDSYDGWGMKGDNRGGWNVTITLEQGANPNPTPEPGTMGLLASALAGMGWFNRKRRRAPGGRNTA
jgi:hypothetical protein